MMKKMMPAVEEMQGGKKGKKGKKGRRRRMGLPGGMGGMTRPVMGAHGRPLPGCNKRRPHGRETRDLLGPGAAWPPADRRVAPCRTGGQVALRRADMALRYISRAWKHLLISAVPARCFKRHARPIGRAISRHRGATSRERRRPAVERAARGVTTPRSFDLCRLLATTYSRRRGGKRRGRKRQFARRTSETDCGWAATTERWRRFCRRGARAAQAALAAGLFSPQARSTAKNALPKLPARFSTST